jgi:hypothetical protein
MRITRAERTQMRSYSEQDLQVQTETAAMNVTASAVAGDTESAELWESRRHAARVELNRRNRDGR